ncbi:polysialyltransferase family glycosyltransferase [Moritella sp. 28]|uniref:polysialyltransferase family glycosyltransferase n=1 Tax=Moritella sp. 28 TaxID=2746232 RepID=UPI001BA6ED51|nr:polysialyltransferase family glycosyltransferase [Moritella sp. 28]QUM83622.1 hypothetical protein HWV02_03355 [Moritella sp. 28]
MNLYVCSTLRHLLFSLLKAFSQPDKKSHIFMISDQQNIDAANFDLSSLPANIEVHFIQRHSIRATLYKGIFGKLLKLMAIRNFKSSSAIREHVHHALFRKTLGIDIPQSPENELFLYNERNKMSRLFRLAFAEYSIIEEGVGNYIGIKLKKSEKIIDFIFKIKRQHRHFGDDPRCKNIYLLTPSKGPKALLHKIKPINFVNDKIITQYGYKFFKYDAQHNYTFIIATQPHVIEEFDLIVYQKFIQTLNKKGIPYAIKVHPREDIEYYKQAFPGVTLIESKIPLELIIFGAEDKCRILSICTSAGTGFEKYCTRLNLIKDDELESLYEIFDDLMKDTSLIDKRIKHLFSDDPILGV